jgi:RimJ/RimL family protein N-acetyltransferase
MDWGPNTPDQTREALTRMIEQQTLWPRFDFDLAIEHAAAAKVIGSMGLHLRDGANRTAESGYCVGREFWRRGLAFEAASALIEAGFRRLDLHRIFATRGVGNAPSFGLMEKLEMRREGCLRQDRHIKGEWRDTYLYAALASDRLAAP